MSGNGKIEIRKGVPVPKVRTGGSNKYPWEEMEVGDHFVFPDVSIGGARSAACNASKRLGKKFVTRNTDEGVACWRVE